MTRYESRAWKRFTDNTVEAAIVDNKTGDTKAQFEEHDRVDGLEVGTMYLRVDDTIDDALRGGNGVSMYFIESIVDKDDEYDPYVEYHSLVGAGGFNEDRWRETTDLLSTLKHAHRNGNLIPLKEVRSPAPSAVPAAYKKVTRA